MSDDFLDRCAESDPETAALLMAVYNEGVRSAQKDREWESIRKDCLEAIN